MTDDPAKPSRFRNLAALLCAACVSAAVWTSLRCGGKIRSGARQNARSIHRELRTGGLA
jgi:hypothetical protein